MTNSIPVGNVQPFKPVSFSDMALRSSAPRVDPLYTALAAGGLWAMEATEYRGLCEFVESRSPEAFLFDFIDEPAVASTLDVRSGLAVVPVQGVLYPGESFYSYWRGEVSGYATIASRIREAEARPDVDAILLDVDSPGGSVLGVTEPVDAVREASKPVVAYAQQATSAAYWISSAAGTIVAGRSSMVGSIGVVARYSDFTKADEKRGYTFGQIVSSSAPAKRTRPVDDQVLSELQRQVDSVEAIFVADVAAGRDASDEAVRSGFGQGGVVVGADGLQRGMIDSMGSFNDAEGTAREAAS